MTGTKESYTKDEAKKIAHRYVIDNNICESGRGRLMVDITFWFYENKDKTEMPQKVLDRLCLRHNKEH